MKQNKIIGILWLVLAVFLLGFFLRLMGPSKKSHFFITFNGFEFGGDAKLANSYSFKKDTINKLDTNLLSEAIEISESSNDEVLVEVYSSNNKNLPNAYVENGVLKIEKSVYKELNFGGSRKVRVYLPGSMNLVDSEINVVSGSIKVIGCNFSSLNVNNTSGSVKIENCNIPQLRVRSTSGSIKIDGAYDQIDLKGVSGSIKANLTKALTKDSSLSTTSGSIKLTTPRTSNYTIDYNCTSGSYSDDISSFSSGSKKKGTDLIGNGSVNVTLRTTSGSIKVSDY